MFQDYPISKILTQLVECRLLPAIVFRTGRKQCDVDVESLNRSSRRHLSFEESEKLKLLIDGLIQDLNLNEEIIKQHQHYKTLITTGAGAHHAGQLLVWRLLLEELMSIGALKLMIATGTVAAGVDFPARTVIITAHSKRGSEGFNILTSSEIQQMSGRAGRRGRDTVGFCLAAPSQYCDARVIKAIAASPAEPLKSVYYASPSSVLNILKHRSEEELRYVVSKSLAGFMDTQAAKPIYIEAEKIKELVLASEKSSPEKSRLHTRYKKKLKSAKRLEKQQEKQLEKTLSALKILNYLDSNGKLTDKGSWAANLCTSLVLELSEGISSGLFLDLQGEELVALIASIAGDSYRNYLAIRRNPIKQEYFSKLKAILRNIKDTYQSKNEVVVQPDAALTVLSWLEARSWAEYSNLLKLGNVSDGDAARLISQTADHLNQLAGLEDDFPELAKQAYELRTQLLRSPISDEVRG